MNTNIHINNIIIKNNNGAKMKIPVDKIFQYVKNEMNKFYGKFKQSKEEYDKDVNEQFDIMIQCKWEDLENLSKEELEKIQPGWLYDWTNVTGHWDYEYKVTELFKKHNLSTLTPREYLNKFDNKELPKHDDVHEILPRYELKSYIKHFLIDDEEFINDVDNCMWELSGKNKLIDKTPKQRFEYFCNTIGNEARTYILKILTLKHLSKILFKNIDGYTDEFWRNRLNNVLNKTD